ncbi:ANTAR domain-containing response regulator [Planctomicrobium sp. SH661]|uniref:ANTAR domain-containing response regulator n=1 Tax=Planctomicrobium sp. SH661 TaxID=3448124 RepID=UPI003F5C2BC4
MSLPKSLKILLAHGNQATRLMVRQTLESLDCIVFPDCETVTDLMDRSLQEKPDLIITGVELQDGDALSALIAVSEVTTIPAIIMTPQRSLEIVEKALHDHVMAYLMEPLNLAEIEPTIYLVLRRFDQFEELRQEVQDLKQALLDRKEIERAKGLLMASHQETEEESYKRLRRRATDRRIKLIDAAREILLEHSPR